MRVIIKGRYFWVIRTISENESYWINILSNNNIFVLERLHQLIITVELGKSSSDIKSQMLMTRQAKQRKFPIIIFNVNQKLHMQIRLSYIVFNLKYGFCYNAKIIIVFPCRNSNELQFTPANTTTHEPPMVSININRTNISSISYRINNYTIPLIAKSKIYA